MDEQLPDFTDKSVVFYVTYDTPEWFSEGIVLESPVFQKCGNRIFVVGQTPEAVSQEENTWSANREAAISWDSVIHYIVLPSEEYQARILQDSTNAEVTNNELSAPKNKNSLKSLMTVFSLTLIGLVIPLVLLIAIIIWIVKML
jgi:hypothetical protein